MLTINCTRYANQCVSVAKEFNLVKITTKRFSTRYKPSKFRLCCRFIFKKSFKEEKRENDIKWNKEKLIIAYLKHEQPRDSFPIHANNMEQMQ